MQGQWPQCDRCGHHTGHGVGNLYHLKKLEDCEGQDIKAAAGVAVGGGVGATSLRNNTGVIINLTSVGQGMDFR